MANMINAAKTHCDHGHEFTPDNIIWVGPKSQWRSCKTCRREIVRNSQRRRRAKDALTSKVRARRRRRTHHIMGVPARFWAQTRFADQGYVTPCVVWAGTIAETGYGVITIGNRQYKAHRLAYEAVNGPIPVNQETGEPFSLDHQCHNADRTCRGGSNCPHRRCVNPDHLEPATNVENVMRGVSPHAVNARKTRCVWGHDFTAENTGIDSQGYRFCRTCRRAAARRHQEKRTAKARAARTAKKERS